MKKLIKKISAIAMALAVAICSIVPTFAASYSNGYTGSMPGDGKIYADGLDISSYQAGKMDFNSIKSAGYSYVILRCGTSKGKDTSFEDFYSRAKAAGLNVGVYYYSYALDIPSVQGDVRDTLNYIAGKKFEYPIYFDFEDPSQKDLASSLKTQIIRTYINGIKEKGYLPGLYSALSWMSQSYVTDSGLEDECEGWVAQYLYAGGHTTKDPIYSVTYGMYQYSSTTYINGVGPFDVDVAYKDYPAIVKKYGFNGYSSRQNVTPKVSNVKATSVTSSGITFSFDAVGSDGLAVDASKVYVWPANKSWDSAEAKTYGYNDGDASYNGALKKSGNTYSFTVNPANHGNQKGVHYSIGIHNKIGSKWTFDKNYGSLAYMANAVNWGDFSSRITNKTTGTSLAMEGSGNNVVFKTTADTTEQIWQFYRQSDGSYKIMNKKSGKALDVMGAYSTAKTNVQVYNDHGGDAQRWFIEPMGSGYSLRAKCATTCVIDIPNGSKDSGTNAWLYTQNNSAAQTFSIATAELPKPVVTNIKYYDINSTTFKMGFTAVGEEGTAIQDTLVYVKPSSKGWDSAECKTYSLGANTDNVSYKGAIKSLGNNRYEFTANVANHGGLKGDYSVGLHVKSNGKFFHIGDFGYVVKVPEKDPVPQLGNVSYSNVTTEGFDVTFSLNVSDGSTPTAITMYAWPSGLTFDGTAGKSYGFGDVSVDFPNKIKKIDDNLYTVHVSVKNHEYYSSNYSIGLHARAGGKNYHLADKTKFVFVTRGDDLGECFTAKVSPSAYPDMFLSSNINIAEGATEANAYVWGWEDHDDQYYIFNRQADGYSYSIKSKRGGYLVFDDAVENFTQIKTKITDEASATKWCVRKIGEYYMISPVSGSSYAMHIRGTQIEQGSKAVLYKTTAAASELFNIEKVSEAVKNDVNGDGAVDIIDVTTIQKYLAGMTDLSAEQQKAADIDGDGEISIKDATKLSKIIANMI